MRVVISSEPRLLSLLRGVVKYRAQEVGLPESDSDAVALAVNEAASNVIRHAYANRHNELIALEIQTYPDRVEFCVEDSGPKVRPETMQAKPLGELRVGGLGLHLINGVMDACAFDENFAEGNRFRMTKLLPRKVSRGNETSA